MEASSRPSARQAFTLVELLVVISIIVLLAALLLPVLSHARKKAQAAYCISNLKQVGLAVFMYVDGEGDFFPCVHGDDYENPQPPEAEWWEMLAPYGMRRSYMLCPSDPHKNDEDIESYVMNGMFAFNKLYSTVRDPADKIIVSERADEGSVLNHQGYPAWKALSVWEDLIEHERHGDKSNYLYADWHAETGRFQDTIGEDGGNGHCNNTNRHYLPEFGPPEPTIIIP